MTADLPTNEFARFGSATGGTEALPERLAVLHEYGRVQIVDAAGSGQIPRGEEATPADITETEALGLAALRERQSEAFRAAKAARAHEGLSWGSRTRDGDGPEPLDCQSVPQDDGEEEVGTRGATSPRLAGRIAVGTVFVSGPDAQLRFSRADCERVLAEVQNGLTLLSGFSPARDVTFVHAQHLLTVAAPETPGTVPTRNPDGTLNCEPFEARWRDAALAELRLPAGRAGVRAYTDALRSQMRADWGFAVFFTKYRLAHYAYAMDNRKVVMGLRNRGFGQGNMDRVFAHETGHIFGAPDEYGGCNCGGAHGPFRLPNSNCEKCAPRGGVACLMRSNAAQMCHSSRYHLGFNGLPPPRVGV